MEPRLALQGILGVRLLGVRSGLGCVEPTMVLKEAALRIWTSDLSPCRGLRYAEPRKAEGFGAVPIV